MDASFILVVECDCWGVFSSVVDVVVVVASDPLPFVIGTTSGVVANCNVDAELLSSPLPPPLLLLPL